MLYFVDNILCIGSSIVDQIPEPMNLLYLYHSWVKRQKDTAVNILHTVLYIHAVHWAPYTSGIIQNRQPLYKLYWAESQLSTIVFDS